MKNLIGLLLLLTMTMSLSAQEIVGDWEGVLEVQGTKLPILFHISQNDKGFMSTMDSPSQGANGIPMDNTSFKSGKLTITAAQMGMKFTSKVQSGATELVGSFNQGGMSLPLTMTRVEKTKASTKKGDFNSPEILGDWNGVLEFSGMQLTVVFHLMEENGFLKGTMDSPDQGAMGIPMEAAAYKDGVLTIKQSSMKMVYTASFNEDKSGLVGNFQQNGMGISLKLSKEKVEKKVLVRPQEPKDFPYQQEEVKFKNKKGGHHLMGTLTIPANGNFEKVVVMVTGSGPQNRDEELLGHKPFLVISDRLTRQGIAVLRYDDRGVGESEGTFKGSTSADFAEDVTAAITFLKSRKDMAGKAIGIVGHSEGGMIAPMVASTNKAVDFIVLLAGPGITISELMIIQTDLISASEGATEKQRARNKIANKKVFAYIKSNFTQNKDDLKKGLQAIYKETYDAIPEEEKEGENMEGMFAGQMDMLLDDWFLYFMRFNPQDYLTKVNCPVLAVNGEFDLQVTPKENLAGIEQSLKIANNKSVTIKEYKGLNHLFQQTETGATSEYGTLEETFNEAVMADISKWILSLK